ncbi:MAG: glycosyltransferase family 4 protein [Anaerolineae bacterium]
MKIAFVLQPWDIAAPRTGGASSIPILSQHLARRLVRAGHAVVMYAKRSPGQPRQSAGADGITYHHLSTAIEDKLFKLLKLLDRLPLAGNPKKPWFASVWYYVGYALRAALYLRREGCDIVHLHNFSQFAPLIKVLNPGVKVVLHMHCEWLTQLDRTMIEKRLARVDWVVSCSDYITQKTRRRFAAAAGKCHTLLNGVDVDRFAGQHSPPAPRGDGARRLLYVGRVSPEKGVHVLLEAFRQVAARFPQAQLDIVGPRQNASFEFVVLVSDDEQVLKLASYYNGPLRRGDYDAHLQAQLPPELSGHVTFTGPVPRTRLVEYFRRADIFIFPSVWHEPFGMPVVEAMAAGLPVVATDSGGITEIVEPGKTGLLVERGNAGALADAIVRLLQDDALRQTMGAAAFKRAAEFYAWGRVAEELLRQYQAVLQSPAEPTAE